MEPDPVEYHQSILAFLILLSASPSAYFIAGGMIVLLLCCSALVSGSEVAYFSISPQDMENLKKEDNPKSKFIIRLLEKPRYLLATILIANNFINISIVLISAFLFEGIFPQEGITGILFNVVLVTFLLVLFGEVAPKIYANINNIKLAHIMARPLMILRGIFLPLSGLLVKSTKRIEQRIQKQTDKGKTVSMQAIDEAIELTVKDTKSAKQDAALLKSIVQFGNVSVEQIMRSRVDVFALENDILYDELLQQVIDSNYSRIPVFKDTFDNVEGILYAKDLLPHLDKDRDFNWTELLRPPFFVPESRKIDDVLNDFQEKRVHIAIVVDEYGGSAGIVTLEDVLEEIIGDIKDEFDVHNTELEFQKLDDHNFIFEGKTLLNDLCRLADLDNSSFDEVKGESNSVAGLLLEISGRMLTLHEHVEHDQFLFKVMEVDKRRIKRIKMTILNTST